MSEFERDYFITWLGGLFAFEGIGYYAYPQGLQPADTKPVYRFWSPVLKTFYWTIDEAQKDSIINDLSHIFTYQGIAWYAYE